MSTFETILPVWNAIQQRFHDMVKGLQEDDLQLQLANDSATVGYMLRHNAEVEYMFAFWFFGLPMPEELKVLTSRGSGGSTAVFTNLNELIGLLEASNAHLIEGMSRLPEEKWHETMKCPIGPSTPLEAVGRLMYHTGIHSGQISFLRKYGLVSQQEWVQ